MVTFTDTESIFKTCFLYDYFISAGWSDPLDMSTWALSKFGENFYNFEIVRNLF